MLVLSTPLAALPLWETQRHAFGPWVPCIQLCALDLGSLIKWRWCTGGEGDGDGDEEDNSYLCVHYMD